ncbi:ATP-binding protein, partial [Streptomyces sp. TRM76130]|nr:ATP-binding protein [Streptomyces sp. TRM76130]
MCETPVTPCAAERNGAGRGGAESDRPPGWSKPAEARRAVERAVAARCREGGARCDADALSDAVLVVS